MRKKIKPVKMESVFSNLARKPKPVGKTALDNKKHVNQKTMLDKIIRLIKPKRWIGRLAGVLSSLIGLPAVGSGVLEIDLTVTATIAIVMAAGYVFGWDKKEIINVIKKIIPLIRQKNKK